MEPLRLRGFTLIELLVVFAIITIVMAIVFTSQSTFNKTLILQNTAYDAALTFRIAQTYGLGSRAIGGVTNTGYGIHLATVAPGSLVLFADTYPSAGACGTPDCRSGDQVYESGQDQVAQTYALGNGITISDFCAQGSSGWSCASDGLISSLDISFSRPNPDTSIRAKGDPSTTYSKACLVVTSPQGGSRYVTVSLSGEISASATPCP